jgi:Bacteriophage Mu Gp45 spike protein
MHRANPNSTSLRAYASGGSRGTVDTIDDNSLMQSHSGNFMKNESRSGIESPQNYGFTSHNMGKDDSGSAETFHSFMGGGRSFPAAGPIDDRRHRLRGLSAGDSAMFRTKDDDTQIHLTSDGMYHSAPEGHTVRMQLVPPGSGKANPPQQKSQAPQAKVSAYAQHGPHIEARLWAGLEPELQQQLDIELEEAAAHAATSVPTVGARAANGGGSGSGGTGQQQQGGKKKPTGQKAVASAGKDSPYYIHVKKEETAMAGKMVKSLLDDKKTYHHVTDKKDYCGGEAGKDQFSKVLTLAGPAINVFGRIG